MWGDEAWTKRQEERAQREAEHDEKLRQRAAEIERILNSAETDINASRVVEMARLLHPDSFKQRKEGLERVEAMRSGPRANDHQFLKVILAHDRSARLSIDYAIKQAQEVLNLVNSWK